MGPIDPSARFPVLTKIIDARAALSVQVHPDDAYAQRVEHEPVGKTECWYVLDAAAGAELVLGWTRDTDRAEVEARIAAGTLAEILRRVPIRRRRCILSCRRGRCTRSVPGSSSSRCSRPAT